MEIIELKYRYTLLEYQNYFPQTVATKLGAQYCLKHYAGALRFPSVGRCVAKIIYKHLWIKNIKMYSMCTFKIQRFKGFVFYILTHVKRSSGWHTAVELENYYAINIIIRRNIKWKHSTITFLNVIFTLKWSSVY